MGREGLSEATSEGTADRGAGFVTRRALHMGVTASIKVLDCNVLNNMENGRKQGHVQESSFILVAMESEF